MRKLRLILNALSLVAVLTACAADKKISAGAGIQSRAQGPQIEYVDGGWTPARLKLECRGPHCRPAVGLLVGSRRMSATQIELRRCTATLIAPDRVLTSAHCVIDGIETHFVLTSGMHKIAKVEWQTAVAPADPDQAPDLAVLKLQVPIDDVTPLRPAVGDKPNYRSLTALVVNATADRDTFRVDPLTCAVRRHERVYPFDVRENPDLIYGFDCTVVQGNSGGPMVAEGDEVQAVVQATVDPAQVAALIPGPARASNKHWIAIATNARCFPLDGQTQPAACVRVTIPEINLRAGHILTKSWDNILKVGDLERASFPTEMKTVHLRLRDKIDGLEAIETTEDPVCIRANVNELTEVKFSSQLVVRDQDEWARPKNVVKDRRVTVGRVVARDRDVYRIEITWPPPYGPLESPDQHPSVRRGSPFNIELPRCPR